MTVIQNNWFVLFKFSRHTTLLTTKSSHDAPAPTTVVPTLQDPCRLINTECAFCTMQPPSVRQCTVCEPSAEYSLISAHLWWRGIWRYPSLHTRVLPETTEDDWENSDKDLFLTFYNGLWMLTNRMERKKRRNTRQYNDWFWWHFRKCFLR